MVALIMGIGKFGRNSKSEVCGVSSVRKGKVEAMGLLDIPVIGTESFREVAFDHPIDATQNAMEEVAEAMLTIAGVPYELSYNFDTNRSVITYSPDDQQELEVVMDRVLRFASEGDEVFSGEGEISRRIRIYLEEKDAGFDGNFNLEAAQVAGTYDIATGTAGKKTNWTPWIIGGAGALILLVLALPGNNKKR